MASISTPTYDPRDPIFNEATLPDEFTLADMAHYPDLPTGLTELTIDGAEIHGREIPLVRTQSWRTFLLKEGEGAAAMIRLNGSLFNKALLVDYLQKEATHVKGFHIREMGLLAACLYDMACAFAEANQWFLDDQRERLPDTPSRVAGSPSITHPLHQMVLTIEIEERVPSEMVMLRETGSALQYWHHWVDANEQLPDWVESGRLPMGLSAYREAGPGQPYAVQSMKKAPRALSSSDTFIVTTPGGMVCLLCLDTLNAFGGDRSFSQGQLMRWLELTHPRLVKQMLNGGTPGWSHIQALCLYVAEAVIDAHREGKRNQAWLVKELPAVMSEQRVFPFVLAATIYEPPFNALEMARMFSEG
jgi:hypothetical protein